MVLDSISDWLGLTRSRLDNLNDNRDNEALIIASDIHALVQLRIQTTGIAYTGSKFSPYSSGYAKQRKKAGAQTRIVDFTLTGEMWRNIRPEIIESTPTKTVVEIKARTANNQMKLTAALTQPASGPRGNILFPNERELAIANEANRQRVVKALTADA